MSLDAEQRAKLRELKAMVKAIEDPLWEAQRKARLKAKRERGKADRGRERDPGYLSFVRRLPCAIGLVAGGCEGPVQAAHLRYGDAQRGRINPGLSVKPSDRFAAPLCRGHHAEQHGGSERAFWEGYGIDPAELCHGLHEAYTGDGDGLRALRALARPAKTKAWLHQEEKG